MRYLLVLVLLAGCASEDRVSDDVRKAIREEIRAVIQEEVTEARAAKARQLFAETIDVLRIDPEDTPR